MKVCSLLAMCALCGSCFAAGDFNPPSWRGAAKSTTQGWTFGKGFALPGDLPDNALVTTRNPYTLPTNILFEDEPISPHVAAVQRQRVNDNGFLSLDGVYLNEDPSGVFFAIPNVYEEGSSVITRIQVVYSGQIPSFYVQGYEGRTRQPTNFNSFAFNLSDVPDPDRLGFRHLTIDVELFQPLNWQVVALLNDRPAVSDIESVVIDTIVPAPGAAAVGLAGLGLFAARRRRARMGLGGFESTSETEQIVPVTLARQSQ